MSWIEDTLFSSFIIKRSNSVDFTHILNYRILFLLTYMKLGLLGISLVVLDPKGSNTLTEEMMKSMCFQVRKTLFRILVLPPRFDELLSALDLALLIGEIYALIPNKDIFLKRLS